VLPPLSYVVPGLIPGGLSLLVGSPKIGKSWDSLAIALAAATGGRALGHVKVGPPRPVLLLALEDGDRRLQDCIRKLIPESNARNTRNTTYSCIVCGEPMMLVEEGQTTPGLRRAMTTRGSLVSDQLTRALLNLYPEAPGHAAATQKPTTYGFPKTKPNGSKQPAGAPDVPSSPSANQALEPTMNASASGPGGPEHIRCNRATAGRRRRQVRFGLTDRERW
jgi:hypothetical protein